MSKICIDGVNKNTHGGLVCVDNVNREIETVYICRDGVNRELDFYSGEYAIRFDYLEDRKGAATSAEQEIYFDTDGSIYMKLKTTFAANTDDFASVDFYILGEELDGKTLKFSYTTTYNNHYYIAGDVIFIDKDGGTTVKRIFDYQNSTSGTKTYTIPTGTERIQFYYFMGAKGTYTKEWRIKTLSIGGKSLL